MLTIFSAAKPSRHGVTRRHVLTAGALTSGVLGFGPAGLSLAGLLRAEATNGKRSSRKSVINIHLDGGPPQMDMIDPKPDAPREIRGEFRPIATKLDGFQISEMMPRVASIADKFAFIRSLVGAASRHDAFQCQTGFDMRSLAGVGGRPAMGSILAKLEGSSADTAPPFVDLMQGRPLVRNSARPGFLGPAYGPFRPDIARQFPRPLEPGMEKELAALGGGHSTSLTLNPSIAAGRLRGRLGLRSGLDRLQADIDSAGQMLALDRFHEQALGILSSGDFARAMDLSNEDPGVIERYTAPENGAKPFETAEDGKSIRKLLLARRLVEAGVRCVSVSISDFDTHSKNYPRMRHLIPIVDHGLHALVTDLDERGMLDDVSIVVWGEFGRTPRVNQQNGGRDHWPKVGMAMLAGGGMKTGQVIGATDRFAGEATDRPVHYQNVFATLYHNLGLDLRTLRLVDTTGRPHALLDQIEPIRELT